MDSYTSLYSFALGTGLTISIYSLLKLKMAKRSLRVPAETVPAKKGKVASQIMFSGAKRSEYIEKLTVVEKRNSFLQKDYHIRDLSNETGIPIHHLSFLINTQFNLHFQDYINGHRVEYFISNYHTSGWQHLTLEGMAWEVGFKSRTTFFRAFLKYTGLSPSEYFHKRKSQDLAS